MSVEIKNAMMTGQDFSAQTGYLSYTDAAPFYETISASITVSGEREFILYREDNTVESIITQTFDGTMTVSATRISMRDLEIYSSFTGLLEDGDIAEVSSAPSGNFAMWLSPYMQRDGHPQNIDPTRPVASFSSPSGTSTEIGTEKIEYYDTSGNLIPENTEEYPITGSVLLVIGFVSSATESAYFMDKFRVNVIGYDFSHLFEESTGGWSNAKWRDYRGTGSHTEAAPNPDNEWTTSTVSTTFEWALA